jgi:hypothetical protein
MTIPTPWGVVFKAVAWGWQRLTKAMFYKTYSDAHQRWTKRHRLGARWQKLGQHVEYSLYLAKPTDTEPRVSKVSFRAVEIGVTKFECVFEAVGAGVRYQDAITVHDLDRSPIVFNLVSIPSQKFLSHLENDIRFSVESYQFRKCVVELVGGQSVTEFDSLTSHLTHTWLLQDTWSRRWGVCWNSNSIAYAKREIEMYWRWGFGIRGGSVYTPLPSRRSSKKTFWSFWRRTVVWLMSSPWIVTLQFWAAIWSGLFILDENDRLRRQQS